MPRPKKSSTNVPATKGDVASLKTDVSGLKTDVGTIKTDIRSLKSDIKEIKNALVGFIHFAKTTFATKDDLRKELKNYPTKDDLKQELKKFASTEDLKREINKAKEEITMEMKGHFTAAIEIIESDLKGAHKDEIKMLTDYKENHEERIVVLEKRTGVQF